MVLSVMIFFYKIPNPEGHPNRITGSKVMAILLNWWILPIGWASSGSVCACSLRSRLVWKAQQIFYFKKETFRSAPIDPFHWDERVEVAHIEVSGVWRWDVNAPPSWLGGGARGNGLQRPNLSRRLPLHSAQSHVPQVGEPFNCQLSNVNCQLSTVYCQLSTENCQLSTENCQLSMDNWQLTTVNCQLPTVNCKLTIDELQLTAVNWQKTTDNW